MRLLLLPLSSVRCGACCLRLQAEPFAMGTERFHAVVGFSKQGDLGEVIVNPRLPLTAVTIKNGGYGRHGSCSCGAQGRRPGNRIRCFEGATSACMLAFQEPLTGNLYKV